MYRRDAIRGLLAVSYASLTGLPVRSYGQTRVRRIVAVTSVSEGTVSMIRESFRGQLKALGYQEGRDITFSIGYGDFSRDRTRQLAADALASKPDVIFAQHGALPAFASLTKTIPIVTVFSADLVIAGYVKSLARPDGNITGIQLMDFDLVAKRVQVLSEIAPAAKRLAVLGSPLHPAVQRERDVTEAAAKQFGFSVTFYPVGNPKEVDVALVAAQAAGANAILLFPDPVTLVHRERIAEFGLQHKMIVISGWENYADAGGLVSYGPNLRESGLRAASFVDRILKGSQPGELPIELPKVVEMVLNMKTANALGLRVPQTILARADRVIA